MNIQHNCHRNQCTNSGYENVRQERQPTDVQRRVIVHNNTADLLLNTAQMRDAIWMSPLRQSIGVTAVREMLETAIYQGVQTEIDKRKGQRPAMLGAEDGSRGRGRGRRGRGANRT